MISNSRSYASIPRIVLVAVVTAGVICYPVWQEWRQQKLNRDLIASIKASRPETVVSLLESGADPNSRDVPSKKSLQQIIKAMWRHKANGPPAPDTAILIAMDPQLTYVVPADSTKTILKALVDKSADVNVVGQREGTPLTMILWGYSLPNARDLIAEPEEHIEWERILLDAGANVNATDGNGFTPLIHAAYLGYIDSARMLLKRWANPNIVAPGNSPDSALSMAKQFEYASIVRLLMAHGARR